MAADVRPVKYDAPVAIADEIRSWLDDRSVGAARVSVAADRR